MIVSLYDNMSFINSFQINFNDHTKVLILLEFIEKFLMKYIKNNRISEGYYYGFDFEFEKMNSNLKRDYYVFAHLKFTSLLNEFNNDILQGVVFVNINICSILIDEIKYNEINCNGLA